MLPHVREHRRLRRGRPGPQVRHPGRASRRPAAQGAGRGARQARRRAGDRSLRQGGGDVPRDAAFPVSARPCLQRRRRAEARLAKFSRGGGARYGAAQYALGVVYQKGIGVPVDLAQASAWYRKAAEQGHPAAQAWLGNSYLEGGGVPRDWAEALQWYRRAADQGNPAGQVGLGTMYDRGMGVPQDQGQAVQWYRRAAEQGLADAQYSLGLAYVTGDGVVKDLVQAVEWIRKAADQGLAVAQFHLAAAYARRRRADERGRGACLVPQGRRPGLRARSQPAEVELTARTGSVAGVDGTSARLTPRRGRRRDCVAARAGSRSARPARTRGQRRRGRACS